MKGNGSSCGHCTMAVLYSKSQFSTKSRLPVPQFYGSPHYKKVYRKKYVTTLHVKLLQQSASRLHWNIFSHILSSDPNPSKKNEIDLIQIDIQNKQYNNKYKIANTKTLQIMARTSDPLVKVNLT